MMKNLIGKIFLSVAFLTIFVFSSASAASWEFIGENAYEKVYVDRTSIKRGNGSTVYQFCAEIKHIFTNAGRKEMIAGWGSNAPKGIENLSYEKNLYYFVIDNGFGYYDIMTCEYYDGNGNCFYREKPKTAPTANRVKPGQLSQTIYDAVYARVYLGR